MPTIFKAENRSALIRLCSRAFTITIFVNIIVLVAYFAYAYLNAEAFFNSFLKNLFTTNLLFGDFIFNSIKDNTVISIRHLYQSFFMPLSIVDTLIFITPLIIVQFIILVIKHFAIKKENAIFRILLVAVMLISIFIIQNNSFSILTEYFSYSRGNIITLLNLLVFIELIVYIFLIYTLHKANQINFSKYLSHQRAKKIVISSALVTIVFLTIINFSYTFTKYKIESFENQLKINYVIDLQKNVNGSIPINPPTKVTDFTDKFGIKVPEEIEKTNFMTAIGITKIDVGKNFNMQLHLFTTQFLDKYINPPIQKSMIAIVFLVIIMAIELIATKLKKMKNFLYVTQFLFSIFLFITIGNSTILFLSFLFVLILLGSSIHIFNILKDEFYLFIEWYKTRKRSLRYENKLLRKSVVALTIENAKYKNIRKGKYRKKV